MKLFQEGFYYLMKKKLASIFSKFEIEFCKKTILEMQFDVTLKKQSLY